jgi:Tfp pilus assembly protein PilN
VNPVNLLPEQYRARRPSSEASGSSRIVIGVLAVLLVMAVAYALSANQVNSRKSGIASARSEIERAKAQTASDNSFGSFHTVRQTRETSVKTLAGGRFDWERLMRETALVLPRGTWVLDMTASTSASGTAGSTAPGPGASAAPAGAASTVATAGAPASPSVHLVGCALHQPDVAVLLVRLRKLHRATDVSLTESVKQEQDSGLAQASTNSASGGSQDCGGGRFKFDVTVTFSAPTAAELSKEARAPVRLGGGS